MPPPARTLPPPTPGAINPMALGVSSLASPAGGKSLPSSRNSPASAGRQARNLDRGQQQRNHREA